MGICSDLKSLRVMGRLNQEHWPDGKTIAPPIPLCSPDANASATQRPVHCCLGHIVRTGGKLLSQITYMARFLWDDVDNFLFDELGSRMRSQIRLSDKEHANKSVLV